MLNDGVDGEWTDEGRWSVGPDRTTPEVEVGNWRDEEIDSKKKIETKPTKTKTNQQIPKQTIRKKKTKSKKVQLNREQQLESKNTSRHQALSNREQSREDNLFISKSLSQGRDNTQLTFQSSGPKRIGIGLSSVAIASTTTLIQYERNTSRQVFTSKRYHTKGTVRYPRH